MQSPWKGERSEGRASLHLAAGDRRLNSNVLNRGRRNLLPFSLFSAERNQRKEERDREKEEKHRWQGGKELEDRIAGSKHKSRRINLENIRERGGGSNRGTSKGESCRILSGVQTRPRR